MTHSHKFLKSQLILINKVKDGIQLFDVSRKTYLQTDRSKEGNSYHLLQIYCAYPTSQALSCCPDGWKHIFAGSRFTYDSESVQQTEGEMLATIFSLEHAQMFILGCTELVISTDYKPLLGFLNNSQDISSIVNPCISNLKQKTRRYQFTTQYNPSKWQGLN